jgi:hypothetical protein
MKSLKIIAPLVLLTTLVGCVGPGYYDYHQSQHYYYDDPSWNDPFVWDSWWW